MIFVEIRLVTSDVDALAAFYRDRLGLTVIAHVAGHRFSLRIGPSLLRFELVGARPAPYHFAFNIPATQFAEAKAWLAERCELVKDPTGADQFHFETWDADAIYFYDPAGNLVELIARHALPNQQAGPFDAHALLGVSEIGVVTNDVRATAERAMAALGAVLYHAAPNDEFMPMGDEHGLLIIVADGRPWFPDRAIRGEAAPIEMVIAQPHFAQPLQLTPQVRITRE